MVGRKVIFLKIKQVELENFMIFHSLSMQFSDGINLIFGENSTGKTAILKILYASTKAISDSMNQKKTILKEPFQKHLVQKITGVFRPERDAIGRLVGRKQGSNRSEVEIFLEQSDKLLFGFGNRQVNRIDMNAVVKNEIEPFIPIYIPPKEIISATGNFTSLYDEFHIEFDETYYDLAKLLLRPLKKGANTKEQNNVLSALQKIIDGNIVQKDNHFYLRKNGGEFEMGLVSEGYRKLSTIMYLILSGSLNSQSILFWDEPESNMNPKMIYHVTQMLAELAKMGVQIFIATHSYFIQQAFQLMTAYPKANPKNVDIQFFSLFQQTEADGKQDIQLEVGNSLENIQHNAIMEEFDALYDRELGMMP